MPEYCPNVYGPSPQRTHEVALAEIEDDAGYELFLRQKAAARFAREIAAAIFGWLP